MNWSLTFRRFPERNIPSGTVPFLLVHLWLVKRTLQPSQPTFTALSPHTDSAVTMAGDDGIKTQLYKLTTSVSFSYVDPAWKIFLRKEVQFFS